PGGRDHQARDALMLTGVGVLELAQDGVQLVELQLLEVEITEKIGRKGAQLLGRLSQPVSHRVRSDLEDAGRSADTQALSQAGQDPHDEFDRGLFAVENGAMGLQKIPLARRTVELAPGTAMRMAVGPQIAQTEPAPVVTTGMRTDMAGG